MFPATITLHNAQQLNAVLSALQTLVPLKASDFASPEAGAAYEEASARVAAHDAAELTTAQPVEVAQARAATQASAPGKPAAATAHTPPIAEAESVAAPETKPAADLAPTSVTYAEVAAAITAAVKTDRKRVIDTLAAFGVQKGPQLKPAQYAGFLASLTAEAVPS